MFVVFGGVAHVVDDVEFELLAPSDAGDVEVEVVGRTVVFWAQIAPSASRRRSRPASTAVPGLRYSLRAAGISDQDLSRRRALIVSKPLLP